jgi:hypothetical protein
LKFGAWSFDLHRARRGGKYHTNKENKNNNNSRRRTTKVGPIGTLRRCNTTVKRKVHEGKQ